jgi:hypothetical protein
VANLADFSMAPTRRAFPQATAAATAAVAPRPARRWPLGVGLVIAAMLSIGLWIGCASAAAALIRLAVH